VAGSSQPTIGDQRNVDAMPPICWGLKTSTGPRQAGGGGELADVGLGGGGEVRGGVAQDHVCEERRFVGAGRGDHQEVFFEGDAQAVAVVGAAEEH
jgi:hypothetical protein